MNNAELRRLQLAELDLFKVFVEICENNQLRYFLDGGTLLGAVRHQGFIPWDEDMDIGMPRKDYDKLCEIANDCVPEGYFFQTFFSDPNYPNPYAKLIKKGTILVEQVSERSKMQGGIYIDILPFDNFPERLSQRLLQGIPIELFRHLLVAKHQFCPWKAMTGKNRVYKFIEYAFFYPLSYFFSHNWLATHYDHILKKYNNEITTKVKEPDRRYGKVTVPYECATDFIKLEFEDNMYCCPQNYDEFLKQLYGDYMQLPPVEERGGDHVVKQIQF